MIGKILKSEKTAICLDSLGFYYFFTIFFHVVFTVFVVESLPYCYKVGLDFDCPGLWEKAWKINRSISSPLGFSLALFYLWLLVLAVRAIFRRIIRPLQAAKSREAESRYSLKVARILLLIILMPITLGLAYKIYRTPPKFLNMTIHVDMFHDDFYVPHKYLDDWSLVVKKRYSRRMGKFGVTRSVAFMELNIPMDKIFSNAQDGDLKVRVVTKASTEDVELDEQDRKTLVDDGKSVVIDKSLKTSGESTKYFTRFETEKYKFSYLIESNHPEDFDKVVSNIIDFIEAFRVQE